LIYADGDLLASKKQVFENDDGIRHLKFVRDTTTFCEEIDGTKKNYTTTFEIECKPEGKREDPLSNITIKNAGKCTLAVTGNHKAGCPILQVTSIV
jgi:hypothetical protein